MKALPWARIVGGVVLVALAYFLITSGMRGIRDAVFGNPEVARERGNTVVATEQGKAEASIADKTIETVRERDVYRERITNVVREGQEAINAADKGQKMDPEIDAAVAAGLCRVHDSLCRKSSAGPQVQPVREPVPGEN